jgi:menaquinol-cytochrome c reductase iron-sulfur subunit
MPHDDEGSESGTSKRATSPIDPSRRKLLVAGTGLLGAGLAATALGPALGAVAYPLTGTTTSGSDDFIPAGKLDLFGSEEPVKVDLYADRVDAWNRVVQVKVGSAWVLEQNGKLVALSTVCPHLGCGIDYDKGRGKFLCACHKSWFHRDGSIDEGPSPRAMDVLELTQDEKLVSIRYQRFKQGIETKEPIG